jgi:hypothetical protein
VLIIPAHLIAAALRRKPISYVLAAQAYALASLLAWAPFAFRQLAAKDTLSPFATALPITWLGFLARILWPVYDFTMGENIPPWELILAAPAALAIILPAIWFLFRGSKRLEFLLYLG